MKTIAVIDDNVLTGDMVAEVLKGEGYHVIRAYSGTEALYLFAQNKPDLVLLDLILPGLSGEEVLTHIKDIPVIILSTKEEVESKVNLLLKGAVDYITKPFDAKELLARVAVQFRKIESKVTFEKDPVLSVGDLTLDVLSLNLTVQPKSVRLTRTECAILKLLMTNSRQVVPQNVLLDNISFETPDCTERSLKQHIFNLRKKMQSIGSNINIKTIRSVGFKLTENII